MTIPTAFSQFGSHLGRLGSRLRTCSDSNFTVSTGSLDTGRPSGRSPRGRGLARHAVAGAVALIGLAAGGAARSEQLIGLTTTNALLSFDSASPTNASALTTITGLQGSNERIVGIDLRPTTGVIYGLSDQSRVYSLTTGGAASFVGLLSTPLASDVVGVDFNPVADLGGMASFRIVSSTGQNIAFNVATGATTVQTAIQGGISSVAYSNNDTNPATATSLYYIDSTADVLKVATANFGAPTLTTVGALGVNANGVNGFDISGSGMAFASLVNADTSKSGLYSIDLATGAASFIGAFGIGGNTAVAPPLLGLTAIAGPVPEPETWAMMALGLTGLGVLLRRRRRD